MAPVFKIVENLDTIEPIVTSILSYRASFDQYMTSKTVFKQIYISCVHRDTYLYVNFDKHIWSFS